jgi:hypothetical protein
MTRAQWLGVGRGGGVENSKRELEVNGVAWSRSLLVDPVLHRFSLSEFSGEF